MLYHSSLLLKRRGLMRRLQSSMKSLWSRLEMLARRRARQSPAPLCAEAPSSRGRLRLQQSPRVPPHPPLHFPSRRLLYKAKQGLFCLRSAVAFCSGSITLPTRQRGRQRYILLCAAAPSSRACPQLQRLQHMLVTPSCLRWDHEFKAVRCPVPMHAQPGV